MRVRVVGVHADAAAVNGDSERDVTSVVGLEEALVIKYVPTHTCVDMNANTRRTQTYA